LLKVGDELFDERSDFEQFVMSRLSTRNLSIIVDEVEELEDEEKTVLTHNRGEIGALKGPSSAPVVRQLW